MKTQISNMSLRPWLLLAIGIGAVVVVVVVASVFAQPRTAHAVATTVSLAASRGTVNETGLFTEVVVTVTLDATDGNAVDGTITLTPDTNNSFAKTSDWLSTSETFTIAANTLAASVTFTVQNDSIVENDEDFSFAITSLSGGTSGVTSAGADPSVTVTSEDKAALTLGVSNQGSYAEGQNAQFTVATTATREATISGNITIAGTAFATNADWSLVSLPFTLLPSTDALGTSAGVTNDSIVENDELFTISVSGFSSSLATYAASQNKTVTVTSDDKATLTLAVSNQGSYTEGQTAQFTVATTDTLVEATISGNITIAGTGFAQPANDWSLASLPFTLNSSLTSRAYNAAVTDDTKVEDNESFTISVSGFNASLATYAASENETVTITDTDKATITVTPASSTVTEGDSNSTITYTVALSSAASDLERNLVLSAAKTGGSSPGGNTVDQIEDADKDVIFPSGTVATLSAGTPSRSFSVTLVGDTIKEPIEAFRILVTEAASRINPTPSGYVTITDNDEAYVRFGSAVNATTNITEGGFDDLPLELLDKNGNILAHEVPVTVTITTTTTNLGSNSAATSADYTVGNSLTITAGGTTADLRVQTTQDSAFESPDEAFNVVLSPSLSGQVTTTKVVIVDDGDQVAIEFSTDATNSYAEGSFADITFESANVANITLKVVTADTDLEAGDYTLDGFTNGAKDIALTAATPKTERITFIADLLLEAVESIKFEIVPADTTQFSGDTIILNITDATSLPAVTASVVDGSVAEGGTLRIDLSTGGVTVEAGSGRTISVAYTFTPGGTNDLVDPATALGTLDLSSGSATVSLATQDDSLVENSETFQVSFTSADTTSLPGAQTLTITDNDSASLTLASNSAATVDEGATVTYTVGTNETLQGFEVRGSLAPPAGTLSAGSGRSLIALRPVLVPALTTGDYTCAPNPDCSFTLTASNPTSQITVTLNSDATVEDPETLNFTAQSSSATNSSANTLTINDLDVATITFCAGNSTKLIGNSKIKLTLCSDKTIDRSAATALKVTINVLGQEQEVSISSSAVNQELEFSVNVPAVQNNVVATLSLSSTDPAVQIPTVAPSNGNFHELVVTVENEGGGFNFIRLLANQGSILPSTGGSAVPAPTTWLWVALTASMAMVASGGLMLWARRRSK